MWLSIFAIFFGAGFGALLRAGFNFLVVGSASMIPLGTLLSNLVGGYLMELRLLFWQQSKPHSRMETVCDHRLSGWLNYLLELFC